MNEIYNKTYFKIQLIWFLFFPNVIFKDKCSISKPSAVRLASPNSQFMEEWDLYLSQPAVGAP